MVNTASAEVDVHGLPRSRLPAVGSRRRAHVARSWGRPGHRSVPVRSSLSPGSSVRWGTVSASGATTPGPVTPSTSPLRFTGGPIEKVVVDASGERYVDHAAQVRGALLLDATGHAPDTCAGTATGDPGLAAPRRALLTWPDGRAPAALQGHRRPHGRTGVRRAHRPRRHPRGPRGADPRGSRRWQWPRSQKTPLLGR
jgi:hypothetical protein